jgi:hypothetical protein
MAMQLRWWRQFDRFDWLSAYFEHRRMRRFIELTVAMVIASPGMMASIAAVQRRWPEKHCCASSHRVHLTAVCRYHGDLAVRVAISNTLTTVLRTNHG